MIRNRQTKEKISQKVWREAENISCGLYRMNAKYAFAYAFNCNEKEIIYGEFLFRVNPEDVIRLKDFDGYIGLDEIRNQK